MNKKKIIGVGACKHPLGRGKPSREFTINGIGYYNRELKMTIDESIKLSNLKEALALIRTLKAGLKGWKEDPFAIIAEVCGSVTDCRRCQWYEKCPFPQNYGSYPEDWRD